MNNPNAGVGLTGIAFTDTLPAGLVVSTSNGLSGSCGTITATAGSGTVGMSGLSLAANANCIFSVNVTAVAAGVQNNVTGAVTSNEGGTGGTASASITVNKDGQTITFGALPARTWGNAPFTVSATASSTLPVTFSVTSGPCSITVATVTITGAGSCVIAADQAGNATFNAAPTVSQTLTVNQASLTVTANNASSVTGFPLPSFTATISGFVNGDTSAVVSGTPGLTTTANVSSPPGTYPITASAGTLTAANYTFAFAPGTLTVVNSFSATPSFLNVQYVQGSLPSSQTQIFTVSSSQPGVPFTVISSAPWLVAPLNASAAASFTVTLSLAALTPGSYSATLTVSSSIGTVQIPVAVTVLPPPTLVSQPASPQLVGTFGSTVVTKDIQLTTTAGTLSFTAVSSPSWLTFTTSGGTTPATLHLQANPSGLPVATYQGTITVTAAGAANSPYTIPVSFVVNGTGAPGQQAIVNSASFGPGTASPNSILSIFGPVACSSSNLQVLVNGTPATILFAGPTQINFVTSGTWNAGGGVDAPTMVQVVCGGFTTETISLQPTPVDPAIFTESGAGTGQGSILNADSSLNSAGNAAARGGYISVYVTGFGTYNPPSPDGLQRLTYPVTATIGGVATNVIYAGQAPTETTGLQQVNLQVPFNAQTGPNVPIVLTVDNVNTQAGVTVAIQ